MKKLTALILVMLMLTTTALADQLMGGWNATESPEMTEEIRAIFDKGMEGLVGVNYVPVAYLAFQVVSGTNHCFLCQATVVSPNASPYYALVYLYENLDGQVTVSHITALDPGKLLEAGENAAEEDSSFYAMVTEMDKADVEAFAAVVKQAYLDADWETIAGMINYPIIMYSDVEVKDESEFLAYMDGKHVLESDREEMENETCVNMFFNGEGICMGAGEVWLADFSSFDGGEPALQIFGLNGIVPDEQ